MLEAAGQNEWAKKFPLWLATVHVVGQAGVTFKFRLLRLEAIGRQITSIASDTIFEFRDVKSKEPYRVSLGAVMGGLQGRSLFPAVYTTSRVIDVLPPKDAV